MSTVEPLPVARIAELRAPEPSRRWLVDGLWSRAAVGIIGGAPKYHKSWLALDLAVSVASGTPCLGAFDVLETGPALLYMAEDDAGIVRARVAPELARAAPALHARRCRAARSARAALPPSVVVAPAPCVRGRRHRLPCRRLRRTHAHRRARDQAA
ncbi:MAG: AAA family ATPase [Sandaracinaceae bacterium]|nr:AAA family ATPase [Sandaracinaceae bacterium]